MFGGKKKKKKEEEFVKVEPIIPTPDEVLYEENKELEPVVEVKPIQEVEPKEPKEQVVEEAVEETDDEVIKLQQRIKEIELQKKMIEESKKTEKIIIVKEYPMAPVKQYVDEHGVNIKLITVEEYLTQQANQ